MLKALAKNGGILGVAYYFGMLDDGHRARFPESAEIGRKRGEVSKQFRDDKQRLTEQLRQLNLTEVKTIGQPPLSRLSITSSTPPLSPGSIRLGSVRTSIVSGVAASV